MIMADDRPDPRTPDDALLTALYLRAEQVDLPDEPLYDAEEGLLRFGTWLEKAGPAAAPREESNRGLVRAPRGRRWWRWGPGIGNLLILACGADYRRMRSSGDRQRYITMGALMFLTTAQAFYCGASVAAMALGRSFIHVAGYGLFLAGSVFFIDRSIVSYIAPRQPGDDRSKKPRHSRWAIGLRIILATAASVLLSEVLLLQMFAPRINVQLASDNLAAQQAAASQINAAYDTRIAPYQAQVDAAQAEVTRLQNQLAADEARANCQAGGCHGTPAGLGPLYAADLAQVYTDERALAAAENDLEHVRATSNQGVNALTQERAAALSANARTTAASQDMLAREQAFWALTVKYPEIAYLRILLMLLLLSIDLAPVIVKVTSSYGVYEESIRTQLLAAQLRTEAETALLEEKIHMEAQVRKARQELDRDNALSLIADERSQSEVTLPAKDSSASK
jgi:Domain of unknown function (DUF4407)